MVTHLLCFVIYCLIWYHFFQTQKISYLLDTGLHFALVADSVLSGPGQAKTKQNKTKPNISTNLMLLAYTLYLIGAKMKKEI